MAPPKVMNGARALVRKNGVVVGVISSLSYSVVQDVRAVEILGRFTPAELNTTAQEAVRVNISGWRVVGQGAYQAMGAAKVQDLLFQDYTQLDVLDRQTNQVVCKFRDCKNENQSGGFQTKALSEGSFSFLALMFDDESTTNAETAEFADLPPAIQ